MADGRVAGKVALVTGVASGYGLADAALLAAEGARVILADIDGAAVHAAAARLPDASAIQSDVRSDTARGLAMTEVERRFERLDILVNNAGLVRFGSIVDCALEDWQLQIDVRTIGTFLGCRHGIPLMARTDGGSIIDVSSVAATKGVGLIPGYSAAKGAIIALTRSTAMFCQEQGSRIRVNAIIPGAHDTPMTRAALAQLPESESGPDQIANHGQGSPRDVTNLVLFLGFDESRQITGTAITIDNGETMR